MIAMTTRMWMSPPPMFSTKPPRSQRMKRMTAIVHSMGPDLVLEWVVRAAQTGQQSYRSVRPDRGEQVVPLPPGVFDTSVPDAPEARQRVGLRHRVEDVAH